MAQSFVIKRRAKQVPPTIFKITKGPVEIDLVVILDLVVEASWQKPRGRSLVVEASWSSETMRNETAGAISCPFFPFALYVFP